MRNEKGQFIKGVYFGAGFKPGAKPWNKGKSGIHLSPESEFKKGMTPWNKGKGNGWIDSSGYRKRFQNTKEHRYIMEQHLGRKLLPTELVHHINEQKADNRLENLTLMTRAEHTKLHKKKHD